MSSRLRPRRYQTLLTAAAAIVAVLAMLAYLAFVVHFGVNVPFKDEWSSVSLYRSFAEGRLSLSGLWAQHNENRLLFPNLLMLAFDRLSHFNTHTEMYGSAALLLLALVVTGYLFARTAGCRMVWFLPAALIVLGWLQYAVALQGYAIALYLLLACLPLSLLALDGSRGRRWLFVVAVALAVIASYSSAQGLAVWLAGLVMLVVGGQRPSRCWVWLACGCATVLIYLVDFQASAAGGGVGWAARHGLSSLHFLSLLLGGILPASHEFKIGVAVQTGVGAILLLLAVAAVVLGIWRRAARPQLALPLALISFTLVIDLMITAGRAHEAAQAGAASSRYLMFNLWLFAGIWLAYATWLVQSRGFVIRALTVGLVALCLVQIGLSYHAGLVEGRSTHRLREEAAHLLIDYRTAPAPEVVRLVDPDYASFRSLAPFLASHRLTVFTGGGS
ncbi:MAG TPA: hypothetical protein VI138_05275 [Candidatus Dormibacteraeota bacterium]